MPRRNPTPDEYSKESGLWDWGDGKTWAIIAVLVVIALAMALLPLAMPAGMQSAAPRIKTY